VSISSTTSSINQVTKEIAGLEKALAKETSTEAAKTKRINDITKSITKNTSMATVQSRQRQIQNLQNDIARATSKKADISKKLAQKKDKLNQLQQKLQKEQAEESKKQQREQVRIHDHYEKKINELTSQLEEAQMMSRAQVQSSLNTPGSSELQYDVFISHASEDKESFVRELADTLINDYAMKVWYDEFSIKWGDSLRRSIDKGLSASRFGIVVISRNFIDKGWTNYELDGLIQKEMDAGKTILPIWHDITKDEVRAFSPSLAGRMALNTAMQTIQEIAEALQEILAS
jgi:hypothetical protein